MDPRLPPTAGMPALDLSERNAQLTRENMELRQKLLHVQDQLARTTQNYKQTWSYMGHQLQLMQEYLQDNQPGEPDPPRTAGLQGSAQLPLQGQQHLAQVLNSLTSELAGWNDDPAQQSGGAGGLASVGAASAQQLTPGEQERALLESFSREAALRAGGPDNRTGPSGEGGHRPASGLGSQRHYDDELDQQQGQGQPPAKRQRVGGGSHPQLPQQQQQQEAEELVNLMRAMVDLQQQQEQQHPHQASRGGGGSSGGGVATVDPALLVQLMQSACAQQPGLLGALQGGGGVSAVQALAGAAARDMHVPFGGGGGGRSERGGGGGGAWGPQQHYPAASTELPDSRMEEHDKYFLSSKVNSVKDIWYEFFHSGPNGRPCVMQLMAKYGMEKWFYRSTTPEGNNNRKNIWNRRNKPIVYEVLWRMHEEGKSEEDALQELEDELHSGRLKTATVAGLAYELRDRGVVSQQATKAKVESVLYSLINRLIPDSSTGGGGCPRGGGSRFGGGGTPRSAGGGGGGQSSAGQHYSSGGGGVYYGGHGHDPDDDDEDEDGGEGGGGMRSSGYRSTSAPRTRAGGGGGGGWDFDGAGGGGMAVQLPRRPLPSSSRDGGRDGGWRSTANERAASAGARGNVRGGGGGSPGAHSYGHGGGERGGYGGEEHDPQLDDDGDRTASD